MFDKRTGINGRREIRNGVVKQILRVVPLNRDIVEFDRVVFVRFNGKMLKRKRNEKASRSYSLPIAGSATPDTVMNGKFPRGSPFDVFLGPSPLVTDGNDIPRRAVVLSDV